LYARLSWSLSQESSWIFYPISYKTVIFISISDKSSLASSPYSISRTTNPEKRTPISQLDHPSTQDQHSNGPYQRAPRSKLINHPLPRVGVGVRTTPAVSSRSLASTSNTHASPLTPDHLVQGSTTQIFKHTTPSLNSSQPPKNVPLLRPPLQLQARDPRPSQILPFRKPSPDPMWEEGCVAEYSYGGGV
jgi:hypothetical protein